MTLIERAKQIKQHSANLCSVPGSGFHDKDIGAPQRWTNRHNVAAPAIKDHLVAFHDKWDCYFVGDDADSVLATLAKLYDDRGHDLLDNDLSEQMEPEQRKAIRYAAQPPVPAEVDGEKRLTIRAQQWNECLTALSMMGVGVTVTGMRG